MLHVLDKTKTSLGARVLKMQLLSPSADLTEINERLDLVQLLKDSPALREEQRVLEFQCFRSTLQTCFHRQPAAGLAGGQPRPTPLFHLHHTQLQCFCRRQVPCGLQHSQHFAKQPADRSGGEHDCKTIARAEAALLFLLLSHTPHQMAVELLNTDAAQHFSSQQEKYRLVASRIARRLQSLFATFGADLRTLMLDASSGDLLSLADCLSRGLLGLC
jgi:hypothetical protein